MRYAILVYETPDNFDRREDPERKAAYWGAFAEYSKALAEAGILTGRAGLLAPHAATTLRLAAGKRIVADGPYADTKEQLGGFFLIEVESLDAALDWAARCPAAQHGVVEVRPAVQGM